MGLDGRKGPEPRVLPDHIWAALDAQLLLRSLSYKEAVDYINGLLRKDGADFQISLTWYKRAAPQRREQAAKRPLNAASDSGPASKSARVDGGDAAPPIGEAGGSLEGRGVGRELPSSPPQDVQRPDELSRCPSPSASAGGDDADDEPATSRAANGATDSGTHAAGSEGA